MNNLCFTVIVCPGKLIHVCLCFIFGIYFGSGLAVERDSSEDRLFNTLIMSGLAWFSSISQTLSSCVEIRLETGEDGGSEHTLSALAAPKQPLTIPARTEQRGVRADGG